MENYPRLAAWLTAHALSFDFLLLQSVGCEELHAQARLLQGMPWSEHFGILLWEEVLRVMHAAGFALPEFPIGRWQQFADALEKDCVIA